MIVGFGTGLEANVGTTTGSTTGADGSSIIGNLFSSSFSGRFKSNVRTCSVLEISSSCVSVIIMLASLNHQLLLPLQYAYDPPL